MTNIILEEGYTLDYHLGISLYFWLIFISIMLISGIFFSYKSYKTHLINQKELNLGNAMLLFGLGFTFIFIQISMFLPVFYYLFFATASIALMGFDMIFIYYWEKNLVQLKMIPTIFSIITFIIAVINFLYVLINGTFIFEYYGLINTILTAIELLFILILIVVFVKRVIGVLRTIGYISIGSLILLYAGAFLDHPPLVTLVPEVFKIITPLLFIIGGILWFYSTRRLCDGIFSYYSQAHICIIHRGRISKDSRIYYCPQCLTIYCQKCFELVIKKEGCWNCQEEVKSEEEDKWEVEIVENNSKKKGK